MKPLLPTAILLVLAVGIPRSLSTTIPTRRFPRAVQSYSTSEPFRILFTGDSIVRGLLIPIIQKRFTTRVVKALAALHKREFSEINQGESNWALVQKHNAHLKNGRTLGSVLGASFNTSAAVVVEWGVNDHLYGYQEDEFTFCYYTLLSDIRRALPHVPIVLMTTVPDFRFPNKHIPKEQAERVWVDGSDPLWSERVHAALHEMAVHFECHIAQAHHAFDHSKELLIDKVHPSSSGHKLIADTIMASLQDDPLGVDNIRLLGDVHYSSDVSFFGMNISSALKQRSNDIQKQRWFHIWALAPGEGFWVETASPLNISLPSEWWEKGSKVVVKVYHWGSVPSITSTTRPTAARLDREKAVQEVVMVVGSTPEPARITLGGEEFRHPPSRTGYVQRSPPRDLRTNANINSTQHLVEYYYVSIAIVGTASARPLQFSATTTQIGRIRGNRVSKPPQSSDEVVVTRVTGPAMESSTTRVPPVARPILAPSLQNYFSAQDFRFQIYNEIIVESFCVGVLFLLSTWIYWRRRRRGAPSRGQGSS